MKEGEQFMSIARLSSYDLQKVIETITIAAIAANTNFFIILSFLIVNIYLNYCLCGFIGEPTNDIHNLRTKRRLKYNTC